MKTSPRVIKRWVLLSCLLSGFKTSFDSVSLIWKWFKLEWINFGIFSLGQHTSMVHPQKNLTLNIGSLFWLSEIVVCFQTITPIKSSLRTNFLLNQQQLCNWARFTSSRANYLWRYAIHIDSFFSIDCVKKICSVTVSTRKTAALIHCSSHCVLNHCWHCERTINSA